MKIYITTVKIITIFMFFSDLPFSTERIDLKKTTLRCVNKRGVFFIPVFVVKVYTVYAQWSDGRSVFVLAHEPFKLSRNMNDT